MTDFGMLTKKPRPSGKVSAQEVAQAAGVSQSTVSRVLSGKQSHLIGEATRKKVLQIAHELGYTPNPIAQALRGSKSNLLGLIVREIADPFFSKLIAQLSIQARSRGYHIVLGHAGSDPLQAIELNSYLDMRHSDGIFLMGDLRGDESLLFDLLRQNRAVVALCRGASPASLHTINTDNRLGIIMLMDHLSSRGHTKYGFVNGGWLGDIRERVNAYIEYLQVHNLPDNPEWIQTDVNTSEGGYRAADKLLRLENIPTAVLASDDEMAIGVIRRFEEAGLRIPADISVTGFDNIDFGRFLSPSLTTIEQPVNTMCSEALTMMVRIIDESELINGPLLVRVMPELVIRESAGPVPK
jgi:DNA-binding LacI/PurR family transcriptional regulator